MLFNSLQFIIFFPIVIALYFLIPYKRRWILLLAASYYFYMCWKVDYIILIMASTIIDYICSNKMSKLNNQKRKKPWLIASIISNLSILFGFKYFNFFSENIQLDQNKKVKVLSSFHHEIFNSLIIFSKFLFENS